MKKSKQDAQKTSELLQKLQEAMLASHKKDDEAEALDSDELAFQKKIAGMLSRVAPQSDATHEKKKKKKSAKKQSYFPAPDPIEVDEPPMEELSTTVESPNSEALTVEVTELEETQEERVEEAIPQPLLAKREKRTRAKKQTLRQKSTTVPTEEPAEEPSPAPAFVESVEEIFVAEAPMEEVSVAEMSIVEEATEAVSVADVPVAEEATEEIPVTDVPVAEEATEEIPVAEIPVEGSSAANEPAPHRIAPEARPSRVVASPKKPTVHVIVPKSAAPSRREKDPNAIVITPKSNLKSTVPIVINPKRSGRSAEPIRVEVKKPMPKAPKVIPSPSHTQDAATETPNQGAEVADKGTAKTPPPKKVAPARATTKKASSGVSLPRNSKSSIAPSRSRTSNKNGAGNDRYDVALENVLFDNSAPESADEEFSIRRAPVSTADGKASPAAMFSTQEILKYTEKKTGLNPDDVSMILELGYEHELSNLIGRDALKKLKAEHVRATRPVDKLRYMTAFGYRNQEYTGEQSRDVILANYVHDKKSLILRLALTALITVLMLPLELPLLFGNLLASNQSGVPMILLPLLSLMGLIFATALSFKYVLAGIRSFLRISPTPYSIVGLLCAIAIPVGIVNLFLIGNGGALVSLNLPTAAVLLVTAICDAARLASEMRVFSILSVADEKTVFETAETNKQKIRHGDKIVKIINDDVDQNLYYVRKSNVITGFFRRCTDTSSAVRPFGFLLLIALTLSFLTGFAAAVSGKDAATVASTALLTLFFALPIPAIILFFYPLCHANRLLNHRNCALVGEESVAEFGQSKTVIYRDKDMYTVKKCAQIMTREGEDFRRDMHLAAILFRKMRGALSALDPNSAEKAVSDPPVTFVRLGENGTEAMVDNRYHLLAGDAKFMEKSGVRIPKERTESTARRSENVCLMYLAINGVLKLTYEIEYEVSPSFEDMVARLAAHNTRVAIRTFDPNLNLAFLEQTRNADAEYIRVIKPTKREFDGTMEISDSGAVALGGRFDLPMLMIAASEIQVIRRYGYRAQLAAAVIGAALAMLLTFLQPNLQAGVALLIAMLFQGVIGAAAWLFTRLVFRFGASENFK